MELPQPFDIIGFGPEGWGKLLLIGTAMTIALSAAGFALGLVLGTILAIARLSKLKTLRFLSAFYTTIIRSVPELLVLYLLFFGASAFLSTLSDSSLARDFLVRRRF